MIRQVRDRSVESSKMKRDDKLMNFKTVLALLVSLCISNLSTAAEIVDVMDAAEPDNPIDVRLDVNYDRALVTLKDYS